MCELPIVTNLRVWEQSWHKSPVANYLPDTPKPALTVFGCNVPTGPAEVAGVVTAAAYYIIMAAGLFGLVVARVRPKRRKDED
jgi:hypothetical protein